MSYRQEWTVVGFLLLVLFGASGAIWVVNDKRPTGPAPAQNVGSRYPGATDCQSAALSYYCTGVTTALGQATTNSDLATALMAEAAKHDALAKPFRNEELREKYQKAGVEDAAKATDPEVMQHLLATCVSGDQAKIDVFISKTRGDCPARAGSSWQKSRQQDGEP